MTMSVASGKVAHSLHFAEPDIFFGVKNLCAYFWTRFLFLHPEIDFIMNKLTLFFLFSISCSIALSAQEASKSTAPSSPSIDETSVAQSTNALVTKYSLNPEQAQKMYTIQARKARNLAQIESLQSTNPALYRAKVQNVQKATLANIQQVLLTQEQKNLYQKTQSELRILRNKKQKEMATMNAPKEEIELALLAIYAE